MLLHGAGGMYNPDDRMITYALSCSTGVSTVTTTTLSGGGNYQEALINVGACTYSVTSGSLSFDATEYIAERESNLKQFELTNHLGTAVTVTSDRKRAYDDGTPDGTVDRYIPEINSWSDTYAFGSALDGGVLLEDYRYGFTGQEKSNEGINGSYEFEYRIYDTRIGRWLSADPKGNHYPGLSTYNYVNNSPLRNVDPDGRDIVVLIAPEGAHGAGHSAVLIGNDKDGWRLFSKNGAEGQSSGTNATTGETKNPQQGGDYFKTLDEFRDWNIWNSNNPDVFNYYTEGYRISTTTGQDEKMVGAAANEIASDYCLVGASCIDVATNALIDVEMDGGTEYLNTFIPNSRYELIKKTNPGKVVDVTRDITEFDKVSTKKIDELIKHAEQKVKESKSQKQTIVNVIKLEFWGNILDKLKSYRNNEKNKEGSVKKPDGNSKDTPGGDKENKPEKTEKRERPSF